MSNRGAAHRMRDAHLVMAIGWLILIPVSFVTGLANSIPFVTLISLWALVATEFGAYQAGRTEVKEDQP